MSSPVLGLGTDDALEFSSSGIMVQKTRLTLQAENVANMSSIKTETGMPYRRKFAIVVPHEKGVRVAEIGQSTKPFGKAYDPSNPLSDKSGFAHVPNVSVGEEMIGIAYTRLMHESNVTSFKSSKTMYQQSLEILR